MCVCVSEFMCALNVSVSTQRLEGGIGFPGTRIWVLKIESVSFARAANVFNCKPSP